MDGWMDGWIDGWVDGYLGQTPQAKPFNQQPTKFISFSWSFNTFLGKKSSLNITSEIKCYVKW